MTLNHACIVSCVRIEILSILTRKTHLCIVRRDVWRCVIVNQALRPLSTACNNCNKAVVKVLHARLPLPAWAESTVLTMDVVCTCMFVCLLTQFVFKLIYISKPKQAVGLRLGNLRQKMVLYKAG